MQGFAESDAYGRHRPGNADGRGAGAGAVVLLIGLLNARVTLGCRGNVAAVNVTNRLV